MERIQEDLFITDELENETETKTNTWSWKKKPGSEWNVLAVKCHMFRKIGCRCLTLCLL